MNKGSIVEVVQQHLIALGRVAKNCYINYLLLLLHWMMTHVMLLVRACEPV